VAQWKGFGGPSGFWDACLEPFTLCAALAARTSYTVLVPTAQAQSTTPYFAAKQLATIDQVSGGRVALNVVAGWRQEEAALFNAPWLEHRDRYDHLTEWVEIAKRVWIGDEPFDYSGKWFSTKEAIARPMPIQRPHPPLINAAQSTRGRQFCAKHADVLFAASDDLEVGARQVAELRKLAKDAFGREVQILNSATLAIGATEAEAQEYWRERVVEKGDRVAGKVAMERLFGNTQIWAQDSDIWESMDRFIGAFGTLPIIGTPEQIVETMLAMSRAGYDGTSLSFLNYEDGLATFVRDVLPLMEQAGLRKPFHAPVERC
jgi:alkanesulfonate monooxygenase SsuD/methylene tetrahydromethanopterin reductase-like flavin-dependent oxidoreductase (luciferase family)